MRPFVLSGLNEGCVFGFNLCEVSSWNFHAENRDAERELCSVVSQPAC